MAKYYNNKVKTGKVAGSVFSVRNGITIERAYQPVVYNPKTPAQLETRAKLKLLTQLAQSIAPVIAMPRVGSVSPRNLFTSRNYEYVGYANGEASINMADILLTSSYAGLAGFSANRASGTSVNVELSENVSGNWDAVCYVMLRRSSTGQISVADSVIVEIPGTDGNFPGILRYDEGDISVHAYGVRFNNASARVVFSNYNVQDATGMARVLTSRTLDAKDVAVSETRGVFLQTGVDAASATGNPQFSVSLVAFDATLNTMNAGGTVTGSGTYDVGSSVRVTATPAAGKTFRGWNPEPTSTGGFISTSAEYTFELTGSTTLYAVFANA